MTGLMLCQQFGQALQAAKCCFTADAGIDDACVWETCPNIGAEQLRPALIYRHIVGGAQTGTQDQDFDFLVLCISRVVNAQKHEHEQDHD